eukprot:5218702-Pleurochrysis_carterae.AAC.1
MEENSGVSEAQWAEAKRIFNEALPNRHTSGTACPRIRLHTMHALIASLSSFSSISFLLAV